MNLKAHCQNIKKTLLRKLINQAAELSDEKIIQKIRNWIYNIPTDTLRTYSVIYLYQKIRGKGISLDLIKKIMLEEDYIEEINVILSLHQLLEKKIITKSDDDDIYSLSDPS